MDATLQDPFVGRLVDGRYLVQSRLARGGMATVYLALDSRLDREVALKVLHGHLAEDATFTSRFQREARAAARLSHPHVVQVYDQGSDVDLLYLAMEYVRGRTLREALTQRGPLSPRQALSVLDPMLDALAAAHRAGIVHRDIKPENVLLSDDGQVKVADFGLARAVTAATAANTGTVIGTVAYMAPELITRGVADARADVYAAGIVLYEMLTGRQPFVGESPVSVAFQHVHEDVPAPTQIAPGLPEALDDLVAVATSRDPDERPRDAAALRGLARGARGLLTDAELDVRAAAPARPVLDDHGDEDATVVVPPPGSTTRPLTLGARGAARGRDVEPVAHATAGLTSQTQAVMLRRRRRGLVALLLLLLVAAGAGVGGWWVVAGPGAKVAISPQTGKPAEDARRALVAAGLVVDAATTYDDTVPAGSVVGTDPEPGTEVAKGSHVKLVVSQGRRPVVIPPLTGKTLEQAGAALRGERLVLGTVTRRYSDTVPEGSVLSSSPAQGSTIRQGDEVTLVVSQGPPPVPVPSLKGRDVDAARLQLTGAGLKVVVKQRNSDTVPVGRVISQSPSSGTLPKGGTVTLVESLGPPMVDVPPVLDMKYSDAEKKLRDAGFKVQRRGTSWLDRVFAQSPTGKAPKGSTITLTTF
ncbi:MAG: Stk1 family PASTA domain-containing Ser/Thr kinase [Kineosporiaceae bacterium]